MDLQTSHTQVRPYLFFFSSTYVTRQYLCLLCSALLLITAIIVLPSSRGAINLQSLTWITVSSYPALNKNELPPHECDYSDGKWTWKGEESNDDLVQTYYTEKCRFLDPGFRCHENGRGDQSFRKWQWRPRSCNLPRFNASALLQRIKNGRIVFVGDSIGRNQWESLLCMLASGVTNQSTIYEEHGSPITKHKGFLSFKFPDHNLTVEYYRVPLLSPIARPPQGSLEQVKGAIRVDRLHWFSEKWIGADVLVFNTGHWWNPDKTINAGLYFQEGEHINMTMDYMEAFQRSLKTLKSWAIQNLDSATTHIFIRGFSPIHYTDGSWQEGTCKANNAPETNETKLESKSSSLYNEFIAETINEMKDANMKADYLNITYLSSFRKDGHPSIHREPGTPTPIKEDCSHWCLPGIPDLWNHLLYAHLLSDHFTT